MLVGPESPLSLMTVLQPEISPLASAATLVPIFAVDNRVASTASVAARIEAVQGQDAAEE